MVPTLVAAAIAALLAAALLGPAFDRRSLGIVVLAGVLPDFDAVVSLVVYGATNAAFHTLLVPAIAGAVLYWDTNRRETSWLGQHYGWRGIRIAWVALAAYLVAGIGLDLFSPEGVNLFYPVHDRFYAVTGRLVYSTEDGLVQTYLTIGGDGFLAVGSPGTTATHHVESWINPTPGTGLEPGVERRLPLVEQGWQAIVVIAAIVVLAIRAFGFGRTHGAGSASDRIADTDGATDPPRRSEVDR
ncbi:metal-dependent hydrolase [Salinarchaeum chitinilyticum]